VHNFKDYQATSDADYRMQASLAVAIAIQWLARNDAYSDAMSRRSVQ